MNLRESRLGRCSRSRLKRVDGVCCPLIGGMSKKAETNNYPGTPPHCRMGAWNKKVGSTGSAKKWGHCRFWLMMEDPLQTFDQEIYSANPLASVLEI